MMWLKMTNNNPPQQTCYYEERFSKVEQQITELKTRLENKKEDIHTINKELATDRQQQLTLIETVTEIKVILKNEQEQRKNEHTQLETLENKVDTLQTDFTDFVASQRSFRNTIIIGTPIIISIIVGIIFKFV